MDAETVSSVGIRALALIKVVTTLSSLGEGDRRPAPKEKKDKGQLHGATKFGTRKVPEALGLRRAS